MAPTLLRKNCDRCAKTFLTYETDLVYCNTSCEDRHAREKRLGKVGPRTIWAECDHCGCAVRANKRKGNRFCTGACRTAHARAEERIKGVKEDHLKEIPTRKPTPPGRSSKIDHAWLFNGKHAYWYTRRGGSY